MQQESLRLPGRAALDGTLFLGVKMLLRNNAMHLHHDRC